MRIGSLALPFVPPAGEPVPTVAPGAAMDIMQRARQEPECVQAQRLLAEARKRLQEAETKHVDQQAYINRAVSNYGIFALCGSMFASMYALSKSGLTGNAAMAGLVVGFIAVPAVAMWLVKRHGMSQAKDVLKQLDQQKQTCAADVGQREAAYTKAVQAAADRLFQSRTSQPQPEPGTVSTSETQVKLGGIVVTKRSGGSGSSAAQG